MKIIEKVLLSLTGTGIAISLVGAISIQDGFVLVGAGVLVFAGLLSLIYLGTEVGK
jgi:hypothetical protein